MTSLTPVYAWPYPELSDSPNSPSQVQALALAIEDDVVRVDADIADIADVQAGVVLRGIKMRGNRITVSTVSTTTEVGVLRIDDLAVLSGRSYRITATGVHMQSTVAGDAIRVQMRYTTDASTPTTSSTILPGSIAYDRIHTINSAQTHVIETRYDPPADQTLSVLLTVFRLAGTGNCSLFAGANDFLELKIEDVGVAVADTGTDI